MLKVDYVLVGRLSPMPDGRFELRYELVSVANGERLLGDCACPSMPRRSSGRSHRVSDAVYEKILGVRGAFATRIAYVAVDGPREPAQLSAGRLGCRRRKRACGVRIAGPDHVPGLVAGRAFARLRVLPHRARRRFTCRRLSTGDPGPGVGASRASTARPAFSPDGSQLALALSRRDGNVDVYVLTLATQDLQRVTDDPAIDTEPAWAPDGRSLYFTSDRAGRRRSTSVGLEPGARPRRITFDGSYNARPRVSPDGRAARGRHPRPRRLPHRGGRLQRGRLAGPEQRPARRVAVVRAEWRRHHLHEPRSADATRSRSSRATAASSSRSPRARASCGSPPGRRSSISGRDAPAVAVLEERGTTTRSVERRSPSDAIVVCPLDRAGA